VGAGTGVGVGLTAGRIPLVVVEDVFVWLLFAGVCGAPAAVPVRICGCGGGGVVCPQAAAHTKISKTGTSGGESFMKWPNSILWISFEFYSSQHLNGPAIKTCPGI
jgi:hypothetical protein